MNILYNKLYFDDINYICGLTLPWHMLKDKTILITGARGQIGSCLIDVLMAKKNNIKIIALGRDLEKTKERFEKYWDNDNFIFVQCDINEGVPESIGNVDYIIHAASNTHPLQYSTKPIETITTNVIGTYNLLNYGYAKNINRFLFASSVEVYGENRGDVELFEESYCGYIDCNTLRAGYPESKRLGESLCQAYIKQKEMDIVIPRISRTYGPTMKSSDTKAISQFIKKGVNGENIVLKSEGTQLYSYNYVADIVSALLFILLKGEKGNAYNIADINSNIMLKDLAIIISEFAGKKVVYELPDAVEALGYSKATKAILNSEKLKALGWSAKYDIKAGLIRTIKILSDCKNK